MRKWKVVSSTDVTILQITSSERSLAPYTLQARAILSYATVRRFAVKREDLKYT